MKKVTSGLLVAAATLGLASMAFAQTAALNEIVANDAGADDHEYVEICAAPFQDLTGLTVVVIEAEGSGKGIIDDAIPLTGSANAAGFYVVGGAAVSPDQILANGWIENGGETILLVQNFTGSEGQDIDADDDGNADGPIGTILDGVGLNNPASGDAVYYGATPVGPDTGDDEMSSFDPAGVARCEDCTGGWGMICLNGGTEPGLGGCDTGNSNYNVTEASPGSGNNCPTVSVDDSTWGQVKAQYR
jgi:hypothetical protein